MARKERRYHYIYKITCLKNGRYYIGMHSTDNLNDGYMGGGKRIKNSVKKHGKDAHRKEILEFFENRELLRQREIQIVNEDLLTDPLCMNLQPGGGGGFINNQERERAIERLKPYRWNRESIERRNYLFDNDPEWSKKYSESMRNNGRKIINLWVGRKHSDESISKMRKSKIGHGIGENNSQFGTCWISKDGVEKKIKKSEIEIYLISGWKPGRNKNAS